MNHSLRKGFTLIELLVVIAIIALIATIVVGYVNQSTSRGRNTRRATNVDQIVKAVNLYYSSVGSLPEVSGWCNTVSNGAFGTDFQTKIQPYMKTVQLDPTLGGATGDYLFYSISSGAGQFKVCATMEAPNTGNNNSFNAGAAGCGGATGITYNYCLNQ